MAYIGKTPAQGNFVKLDAITCSSTNTYNLTSDSVAFVPESALHMMVSLNGVIQAPLTSFSISGSTITFLPSSGTLSSSDTIDFILVLGNVLDIGTPSDSTVTNAKTNFVTTSSSAGLQIKGDNTTAGALQLNCEQNSHGIKLQSPAHSANQSYTLKFPTGNVTADKVLKVASVTGSGATGVGQLSFADDSGGLVLLQTVTASNDTTVTVGSSSLFTSTYKVYQIHVINAHPTDNTVEFRCRMSKGGSVITASEYEYARHQVTYNSTSGVVRGSNSDGIVNLAESVGNAGEKSVSGVHTLYNPAETTFRKLVNFYSVSVDVNSNFAMNNGMYAHEGGSGAIDGMQFFFNGGNIESGTFKLYGVV